MRLFSSIISFCLVQAVCSTIVPNSFDSGDVQSRTSASDLFSRRRLPHGARSTSRFSRRQNQDERPNWLKVYVAIPEKPDDKAGNEDAQKLIEQKLGDEGKIKKMTILKDPDDESQILGWGALQIDDKVAQELTDHQAIKEVVEDQAPKKRLSIGKPHRRALNDIGKDGRTALEKRALDWDQLSWRFDPNAPSSLMVVSQHWGKALKDFDHFVYESHRGRPGNGQGIYIYIIEEGIQTDVEFEDTKVKEFPSTNREQSIYTDHCIAEGKNTETDEDNLSHGTNVASAALGQYHGVAKGATLVPVKYYGPLTDMALALFKAEQDILGKNRQQNSIVVLTAGGESATDPVDILRQAPAAADTYKVIRRLHDNGVPVITPAGNDRDQGRDKIDFWPSYWEADDFPLINVAETDDEGIRSEFSQAGDKVTTWAATYPAWVQFKDGKSKEEAGTSLGSGIVAGVIAQFMSFDEQPWGPLTGRRRVEAIRQFMKGDQMSGWVRDDVQRDGQTLKGERVVWNGAKAEYHQKAVLDPDLPVYPDKAPPPPPPTQEPPKGQPKSLQIVFESYIDEGAGAEQHWNYFEGEQGKGVDPCGKALRRDKTDQNSDGWNPPLPGGPDWVSLRFSGYAEDCQYQGLGEQRPDGDVGWLHCPERPAIKCVQAQEKTGGKGAWKNCEKGLWTDDRIPVAYCDWS